MIPSGRWQQVSHLYQAALERRVNDRSAFLDEACAGDAALRQEVESLLAQGQTAERSLAAPALEVVAQRIADDAGPSLIGRQLGSYRIQSLLGAGGMGEVYRARDPKLGRDVALKLLPRALVDEPERRTRLLREARAAASLNHPNICTVYEVGEAEGQVYIAMELVEGRPLSAELAERSLAPEEVLRIGLQLAEALGHAHERGVVHRDLKSANVMITPAGWTKMLDFGLATRLSGQELAEATTQSQASLTQPGALVGTLPYMAPEQLRGQSADARTDVWALGVVLYETAAGVRPFQGQTGFALSSAIFSEPPPELPSRVPAPLQTVVRRCLEKEPARRYQRGGEVRAALEAIGIASVRPKAAPPQRKVWVALAALVVLSIGTAVGYRTLRGGAGAPIQSIAVLPFDNLTGDPSQADFVDGLTDALTDDLSRIGTLRVISRSTTAAYREAKKTIPEIGRELNVGAVLEGSIARIDSRVNVAAELIQASNGRQLWSETYERNLSDLLTLQSELARAVVEATNLQTTGPEGTRLTERRPVNPEAYDLYLRGKYHAGRLNENDIDLAIALYEKSAAIDSTFGPTQAGLALVYGNKSFLFRPRDPQWEEKGFAAVARTLALDPNAPEAHYVRAVMLWRPAHAFPSREALAELRQAVTSQPNFDEAWHQKGVILFHIGHLEAALRDIRNAITINPANTLARFRFGPILTYQLKHEEAIAALRAVPKEVLPANWEYQMAWNLLSLGRFQDAKRGLEEALKESPDDQGGLLHSARAMLLARTGDRRGAEADIAEAIKIGKGFGAL